MSSAPEIKFRDIDTVFADFIVRLAGENTQPRLKETVLNLSYDVGRGASCIQISDSAVREELLRCTPAVGEYPDLSMPLVLDGNLFYFQKMLKEEIQLAELFKNIARRETPAMPADTLDEIFAKMPASEAVETQKKAVRNCLTHALAIICGGPGTGKTTVASALLCQELLRTAPEKIAIAAPTGKAHARLMESLLSDSKRFDIPEETRNTFSVLPGGTIHRLLGWGNKGPKYNKENPLPYDLILLDESSMVSLNIMTTLLSALAPHARLVLLGDAAQLASVEAGMVFSDLCKAAKEAPEDHPLRGILTELTHNFRAASAHELIKLAVSLREGVLPNNCTIAPVPEKKKMAETFKEDWEIYQTISECCSTPTPGNMKKAFELLDTFKIICAVKDKSNCGTAGLNSSIMKFLDADENTPGVPIMIRHNSYDLGLFNGDTGLIIKGKKAFFPGFKDPFPLGSLPEYDIAYTITAHKSQGSGYNKVVLLLPEEETPLVNRELIYTAVTRAREEAMICGKQELVLSALADFNSRASGLAERLLAQ